MAVTASEGAGAGADVNARVGVSASVRLSVRGVVNGNVDSGARVSRSGRVSAEYGLVECDGVEAGAWRG